jgi:hypothetical protein
MDVIVSETNKKKKCLKYDGLTFRVDRILKKNDISWRCTNNKSKCKARVRTDGESKVVMSAMSEHNHEINEREIESKQLPVMAKRKASDDISARPSKIIRQELQKLDESNLQTKDLKNVALAVYRERRRELPVLPKYRNEAHEALKSINLNTNKDESFMMVNDQENGIIVFTCNSNLTCLSNDISDIFVDGTFKYCTKFFHQLYTIHGCKNKTFNFIKLSCSKSYFHLLVVNRGKRVLIQFRMPKKRA